MCIVVQVGWRDWSQRRLDNLLLQILTRSREWIQAENCSVFLPCPDTQDLVIHSAHASNAQGLGELRIPRSHGIVGYTMREKRIIRVDDVYADPRFSPEADKQTGWLTKSILAAPLLNGDDCIGVIEYLNPIGKNHFSSKDEELIEYFSWLAAGSLVRIQSHQAQLEKIQVMRDLALAREIQTGLLPSVFPNQTQLPSIDLHAALKPALEVSGDLYDVFAIGGDKYCAVVGDVSGKGIAAGLFMGVARTVIRAIAQPSFTPAEILQRVNAQLVDDNPAMLFITIILVCIVGSTGKITYATGGHNPPVFAPHESPACFAPSGGQPLGIFPNARFVQHSMELHPGDLFFLYTDGVTEAMDSNQSLFSDHRLLSILSAHPRLEASAITRAVIQSVDAFANGAEQSDDIAVMALRHR
ncbi:MAG: PP2C family protein-serine/threonine phosphatase [Cyanobium sp.]